MTPQEEMSFIFKQAKRLYSQLLSNGCKASTLYDLEQVMMLCKKDPSEEAASQARSMMASLNNQSYN